MATGASVGTENRGSCIEKDGAGEGPGALEDGSDSIWSILTDCKAGGLGTPGSVAVAGRCAAGVNGVVRAGITGVPCRGVLIVPKGLCAPINWGGRGSWSFADCSGFADEESAPEFSECSSEL